jgi:hypothetical protein
MHVLPKGLHRIRHYGLFTNGDRIVEFRTAAGEALAISIPRTETTVIEHFQERMPYGLFVPGRSLRNIYRAHGVSPVESSQPISPPVRVPETPPVANLPYITHSGRGSRFGE